MWIFLAQGHRDQASPAALAALEQAEALYADDAYLHFLRGYHLEQLGRVARARAAYVQGSRVRSPALAGAGRPKRGRAPSCG